MVYDECKSHFQQLIGDEFCLPSAFLCGLNTSFCLDSCCWSKDLQKDVVRRHHYRRHSRYMDAYSISQKAVTSKVQCVGTPL